MTEPNPPMRRALAWAASQQWAIERSALTQIIEIASREHVADFDAVAARQGKALSRDSSATLRGDVAVVSINGPIFRYASMFSEISGATSIEQATLDLQAALNDPQIRAVVLDIDSPGGVLAGVSDFAKAVRAGAARKHVVGFVGGMGASAAFWIASAARELIVSDTAVVGSVGVISTVVVDDNAKVVEIVSTQSPQKRPDLRTDAGRKVVQKVVDDLANVFIDSVARYRGTSATNVLKNYGQGSVLVGRAAVEAGMADGVGTFESVLASFDGGGSGPTVARIKQDSGVAARGRREQALTEARAGWDKAIARLNARMGRTS